MAIGPVEGLLEGWLSGKKTAGTDVGNALNLNAADEQLAKGQLGSLMRYQDDPNIVDPIKGSQTATSEVQNNAILGQLFGPSGTLGRTVGEEKDLASRGYSLKPEDHEAYGQASDDIARMFGQSENSLAQALQQRGLGASTAMAGQAFAGSQGNKMEQLAGMQRKIANDRMQSNMNRLAQTRSFLGQMGGQAQGAIQDQYGRQMQGADTQFQRLMDKNMAAQSRLQAQSNQANTNLRQRMGTQKLTDWARAGMGGIQGMENAALFITGQYKPPAAQKDPEKGIF